ncbi:MAG: phosphoribosylanthranilate isomerase [Reichenbachiella sp.]
MEVKVCGIRDLDNLHYLQGENVDMIGFIFYDQSKRFFENGNISVDEMLNAAKKKVGVFVNASLEELTDIINKYQLDAVQLHGEETPKYCAEVAELGVYIIKAFSVLDHLPRDLGKYEAFIDLYLFDTKGVDHGGNGIQFNWSILEGFDQIKPFMVSGGIGPKDVSKISNIKNPKLKGVDVNSRFEIEPGLKDEALVGKFIEEIKGNRI